MEDGCSAMYNHAIKAGISDGIARGFKDELWSFKHFYRTLQEQDAMVAGVLRDMRAFPS